VSYAPGRMCSLQVTAVVFCGLLSIAVLFPPVDWGSAEDRALFRITQRHVDEPPRYTFLFGPRAKRVFSYWGWEEATPSNAKGEYAELARRFGGLSRHPKRLLRPAPRRDT